MPKMFNIMDVTHGELLREGDTVELLYQLARCWHSAPRLFMNVEDANATAMHLSQKLGRKFNLRPVKMEGEAWKNRELERLLKKEYTALPWRGLRAGDFLNQDRFRGEWTICYRNSEAKFHFPHLSDRVKGNIAFTENDEKGAADVQTTMKPGKYLKRFYPTLPADHIKNMANEIIAMYGTCEFHLARTPDEIELVYLNGPNSCMASPASSYNTDGIHPVRVYGAGDLAIAYLVVKPHDNPDASAEENEEDSVVTTNRKTLFGGTICSRSLVWPEHKLHGRIYGDTQKMSYFLKENGYTEAENWSMEGARLLRIPIRRGQYFVCPYIDGDYRNLRDDKKNGFLVLDPNGPINGETTTGCVEVFKGPEYTCSECGDIIEIEDENRGEGYRPYVNTSGHRLRMCQDCYDAADTFFCTYSVRQFVYANEYCVTLGNGATWHQTYVDRYAFCSAYSNEYWPVGERVVMGNGDYWSREERNDHGEISVTGQYWPRDEIITCADGCRRHLTEITEITEIIPASAVNQEGVTPRE